MGDIAVGMWRIGGKEGILVRFFRIAGALAVLSIALCGLLLLAPGCALYDMWNESYLTIINDSGFDVRFDRIVIGRKVQGGGPEIYISRRDDHRSLIENRSTSRTVFFLAPRGAVGLQVVTVNDLGERETVKCNLDNRGRPCSFTATYVKGRLFCHGCQRRPSLLPGL